MSNHPTGGDEKDVPIPPPRVFAAAAVGGLVGAAAGAMLAIWLIGCCCDDADTRTSRVETTVTTAAHPVRVS